MLLIESYVVIKFIIDKNYMVNGILINILLIFLLFFNI